MRRPPALLLPALAAAALAACREGSETGAGGPSSFVVPPNDVGSNGCHGPDQAFAGPLPLAPVAVWSSPVVGPSSRLAAALDAPELYVTGEDGVVVELDLSTDPPGETVLVQPGVVTGVLQSFGVSGPAELSGVAITTGTNLVVVEHFANALLVVNRDLPDFVVPFGTLNPEGGFVDGGLFQAKFQFDAPTDLLPTADNRIFVADSGNHVLRAVESTPVGTLVRTVAGTGMTDSIDGGLLETSFDTPWGLTLSCAGELLVTEAGAFGDGDRLRSVVEGFDALFGAPTLESATLAGDGTEATVAGVGDAASLAAPSPPVATAQGDVYWVDRATGVLRRYDFASELADCPLDVDCPAAIASTPFTPGGAFSLAIARDGELYVLDAAAETLYRIP